MHDSIDDDDVVGREAPFEPTQESSVAGTSAIFQSLARVFQRGGDQQRDAARQILLRAGVWMPVETYRAWPVVLPWIVRDNSVAPSKNKAAKTGKPLIKTASPTTGLMRSDNSPVGGLKNDLPVRWAGGLGETFKSKPIKVGAHEWMQSHCWSFLSGTSQSAATHPLTNSFVPNLVWLPDALGRLTDDERLVFADELRSIAWARYRHVEVDPALYEVVEEAWSLLEPPSSLEVGRDELTRVNEFVVPAKFYTSKIKKVLDISMVVEMLQEGVEVGAVGLTPAVYLESLASADAVAIAALQRQLSRFSVAARQFVMPQGANKPSNSKPMKGPGAGKGAPANAISYGVHSQRGVVEGLNRTQAAIRLVHEVISAGVTPHQVHQVLKSNFRHVSGQLSGEALWEAMSAAGAPGTKDKWFVDEPIHHDGDTWVLKKNSWTKQLATKVFPDLAELSGGLVGVTSSP